MTCYYLINKITREEFVCFGYCFKDACSRYNLNPDEWIIDIEVFED